MAGIAILGAGELGGALARRLAAADLVNRVVLIDEAVRIAEGTALDIRQAAPLDGYGTSLSGTSDIAAVMGAACIVLADRADATADTGQGMAHASEWQGDAAVGLLRQAVAFNAAAPVLCAGGRQMSVVERGVRELGLSRRHVLGTAPEALRSAVMAVTALEASCDPRDVSVAIVGRPPGQIIVPWDEASIAGRRATAVLSPAAIVRLDARLARLWPPGPVALASAATRALRSAFTRSPLAVTTFVALERDEGRAGRAAMLPVALAPSGIAHVLTPSLSTRDRVRLETVLQA